jgi:hypothetical protein
MDHRIHVVTPERLAQIENGKGLAAPKLCEREIQRGTAIET